MDSYMQKAMEKQRNPAAFADEITAALNDITGKMMDTMNPVCEADIPLIICACRCIEKSLTQRDPMAGTVASGFSSMVGSALFTIPVPPGYEHRAGKQ